MGALFWTFAVPPREGMAPDEDYVVYASYPTSTDSLTIAVGHLSCTHAEDHSRSVSNESPFECNAKVNESVAVAAVKFNSLRVRNQLKI